MAADLKSMNLDELTELLRGLDEPAYRARQVYSWLHKRIARSFTEMSDLSKGLRGRLEAGYDGCFLKIAEHLRSKKDGCEKYLFALHDGNVIESVLMRYRDWNTVCVSSQVGCRMGCKFCASTLEGCVRSLSAGEMLDQVYAIQKDTGERVGGVVVMGSGEPLDNYAEVLKFIRILSGKDGLSQRSITISTCGIVPDILRLADEKLEITLALSLHAPSDAKRRRIMPIAARYTIDETLNACGHYFEKTGRRVTLEYALLSGFNDGKEDAEALSSLAKNIKAHVNIIPVNRVPERDFVRSDKGRIKEFQNTLMRRGISATVRRSMGEDISGACGQLRRSYLKQAVQYDTMTDTV